MGSNPTNLAGLNGHDKIIPWNHMSKFIPKFSTGIFILGIFSIIGVVTAFIIINRPGDRPKAKTIQNANSDDSHAMILIPAGPFKMGRYEKTVDVDAFLIDKFEVLRTDYLACVEAEACAALSIHSEGELMPINGVNWYQADAYCRWASKRLPTNEEWEKAARGTEGGHKYPWGDNWEPTFANWRDSESFNPSLPPDRQNNKCEGDIDGYPGVAPINAFPKNISPYGVMQMCGNLLEWTSTSRQSPIGEGIEYGVRGGSWWGPRGMGIPTMALITWETIWDPAGGGPLHQGIRCAKSAD